MCVVPPVDWIVVWRAVAARVDSHTAAGRTHVLTEDVLRFETVLALEDLGVSADRLRVEVLAPALAGGKLDLVVDPPRGTVVEFKFPRDSSTGISPDTLTLGALLRDFFRVAAVPAQQRWVVQLLNVRLIRYLDSAHRRYGLGWAAAPGQRLQLAPAAVSSLPATARRPIGGLSIGGGVKATCMLAEQVTSQLTLFAYWVDALWPASQALEPAASGTVQVPAPPEPRPYPLRDPYRARSEILDARQDGDQPQRAAGVHDAGGDRGGAAAVPATPTPKPTSAP
jgi:hypothetical protein